MSTWKIGLGQYRNERLKTSEQLHLSIPDTTSALVASFGWTL